MKTEGLYPAAATAGLCGKSWFMFMFLFFGIASIRLTNAGFNRTAVLESILTSYDNRIRPDGMVETSEGLQVPDEDLPLKIRTEIYIENVDSIKESTMDFSLTLYLRLFWQDTRLAFSGNRTLRLGSQGIEKIWVPDIYFLLEKNARVHTVTQPNKLMRVQPNGSVSFSQRISLTVACRMHLHKFPMDSQTCTIIMSSYAYTVEDIVLSADNRSIGMEPNITIPKFNPDGMGVKQGTLKFSLGDFSSVSFYFYFVRQMESYLLTVYIPTMLMVTIAWLSFWIDAKAAPARVALGVTTVLTVTTMMAGMQETVPLVTYAKAIDVWFVVCLIFVFFALVEYGMANYLLVTQVNSSTKKKAAYLKGGPQEPRHRKPLITADRLDRCARWAYPIAFLLFVTCYWITFLAI